MRRATKHISGKEERSTWSDVCCVDFASVARLLLVFGMCRWHHFSDILLAHALLFTPRIFLRLAQSDSKIWKQLEVASLQAWPGMDSACVNEDSKPSPLPETWTHPWTQLQRELCAQASPGQLEDGDVSPLFLQSSCVILSTALCAVCIRITAWVVPSCYLTATRRYAHNNDVFFLNKTFTNPLAQVHPNELDFTITPGGSGKASKLHDKLSITTFGSVMCSCPLFSLGVLDDLIQLA